VAYLGIYVTLKFRDKAIWSL